MEQSTNAPASRILIPLDGSVVSSRALRIGFALAERAQLPATLLHVHDGTDDAEQHLSRALERFAEVAPCDFVVAQGHTADVIIEHAQESGALVCMASHGRSGLARLALGSVAEEVVRRNPASTVVVGPNGARFALARELSAMLFCTDGSERAESAAPLTARVAQLLNLRTTIVQQVPPDENVALDGGTPPRPLLDAAKANCEALLQHFASNHPPTGSRILFGETAPSIVQAAVTEPATLIALASHGRTGFRRFSLGSTAAAVVQLAECPVLVVGPAASAAEA